MSSGYLDRRDPHVPPMTRGRWIGFAAAALGVAVMLFIAVYARHASSGLLGLVGRIPAATPLMFSTAAVLLLVPEPGPANWRPRMKPLGDRRLAAAIFFAIGIALLALPFVTGDAA
jgi:hypothetical protein